MSRGRDPWGTMIFTTLIALVLSVLPLPTTLDVVRPAFLVLAVLYWSVAAPRAGGLGLGFIAGIALDVFKGAVLGQHALAVCAVAYVAVREHQKIRSKPVFQQSLIAFAMLLFYEFMVFAIDGWSGHPALSWARWIHPLTGALVWPIASALLGRSHTAR